MKKKKKKERGTWQRRTHFSPFGQTFKIMLIGDIVLEKYFKRMLLCEWEKKQKRKEKKRK